MSGLSVFLRGNKKDQERVKFVVSKSFLDADGKPVEWEVQAITAMQDERLRKACTKKVPVPERKNMFVPELDVNAYMGKVAALCTVYPDLSNAELQNSYEVMGEEQLLQAMLLPGEYQEYLRRIQEINGFDVGMDELVETAKN